MSRADPAADPVLATERTGLAWTRSALSLAAIGALILRAATEAHLAPLGYPVGGVLLLGAALLWIYGSWSYRGRRSGERVMPEPATLRLLTGLTVVVAMFALAFALVITL
jgi:uncharacterized membrane protein YidH (DUF202 family)